uniref:Supervillin c n=1 Tax=Poecilia latipinna TaxID=48699 RepID=A0A3B3V4B9_9TELE
AERIARYKAERRRELAERYGDLEELPSKWVRRDGKELSNPATSDASQLHTRVSVGQLRSSLLQQTEGSAGQEKLDLAAGPEGGRRRGRRYLQGSAVGRKTSERFRTQPITANEMEESTDVKTDDRAKMSVAAKMSLFRELEKSAASDSSALLKPHSANSLPERRARRNNDLRFLTQPITCEEMVSMREKLALFNRLSVPEKNGSGPADGPPERRKQKGARYRTQPITVDELQKGPIQLPAFSLSPNLYDRQQASSVNLKPSEMRLTQPKSELSEPEPAQRGLQDHNSEPCLKGILKKSRPDDSEGSGTDGQELPPLNQQNGEDCTDPELSSAVTEHRRAVRPSRRTQGSRNPLRALAAREDIRQDYMGERDNSAAEERDQAEKSHPVTSSEKEMSKSFPPFSNLMLIHIKRRQVQVRVVEPSVRSLNSGDCFLLVDPNHCILWSGEFANKEERAKFQALELAAFIQSRRELGCRASQVVHLEEGLNTDGPEAADFWRLLGGRKQYRAGAPEEDELFEQGVVESNCVYSLMEDRLVPHEQAWASIPSTALLDSSEFQVLVFDFGSEVYLWHGRDVSPSRRNVALQLTHQVWVGEYDYSNCRVNPLDPTQCNPSVQRGEGRPSWALLAVVTEDNETALFREKFLSCDIKALASGGLLEGDASVRTVLSGVDVHRGRGVITLEEGRAMELRTVSVDTWHVQEFDDSEIQVESTGQLHEGDSYVIRWTYSITAFLVVPQGKEPPCFLQLFQGGLVIHADWRLFCVRGELPEEALLLEGDCCCSSLRSRGSVVLLHSQQGVLYLWTGCKAHSSTREVSKRAVERLIESPSELGLCRSNPVMVHFVEEGSEPSDFWTALGQMDRKAYDCMLQPGKYNFTPRLFHLSASSGRFEAEELRSPIRLPGVVMAMPFVQESLYSVPQPLFLLDNRLEVYLWQRGQPEQTGSSAAAWSLWHSERKCAMQTVLQYCKINPRRPPQAYLIFEGSEPLTFTNVFPRWERNHG